MSKTPPPYTESHNLLAGKTVLITAAAGAGIGLATAKRCAEEGATVMISDIHEKRLVAAAEEIKAAGGGREVPYRICNVTSDEDVRALADAAVAEMGHIDVLVNNAGLGGTANVVDMTDKQWDSVLDITLSGCFRMTRAVLPFMMERKKGVIVNNASVLGWRAQEGQAHYAAAKAGVMALTRCSAIEAAPHGVRINAVSPSLAVHEFLTKVMDPDVLADLVKKEAFGRGAETWEVANVIVFLASEYSTYLTGEIISVSSQHA
jgi:3-oxoacyl-[acyl-carrier protein] reductase